MSQSSTAFLAQQERDDADQLAAWPVPAAPIPAATPKAAAAETLPF